MAGAIQSSAISKFGVSAQSALRGPIDKDNSSSREQVGILAFASPDKADGDGEDLVVNEIDFAQDSDQTIEALQSENAELKRRLAALEEQLNGAGTKGEDWGEQDREFARMMEEKTDVIRELHLKIQAMQAAVSESNLPATQTPGEADLFALSDELERERNQLLDDEKALMQQMRIMEVQMSRERAELARQRTDIERLHIRMQDELELASREASLKERLQPLMRQHQTMMRNGSSEPPARVVREAATPEPVNPASTTTSGLFRRLFGAGG
jgi:chromosome segregation ATPase